MGIPMSGAQTAPPNISVTNASMNMAANQESDRWRLNGDSPQPGTLDDFNFTNMGMPMNNVAANDVGGNFTWEMIGLGLEEPLPPQETIDELHQVYFEKVHPSVPMVHKYRYLAAMNLYVSSHDRRSCAKLIDITQSTKPASTGLPEICHVDHGLCRDRQIFGSKRPILPEGTQIC